MNVPSKKPPVHPLSNWYQSKARPLPWRKNHNPYFIWISEVMLQQTQVATVIPYFNQFIKKFPTIQALANAQEANVLSLWSGLGYYSRARNLQKGAQYLIKNHQGKFPKNRQDILQVPGIGPYTAGAILSIAFNLPEAIVDGNVQRVFARYFAIKKTIDTTEVKNFFWEQASKWVIASEQPRDLNQAIMELGATICTRSNPKCEICPISKNCEAKKLAIANELPIKKKKKPFKKLVWLNLVYEKNGKYLFIKNKKGDWWENLWDLPKLSVTDKKQIPKTLSQHVKKLPTITSFKPIGEFKHTVTNHKITSQAFVCHVNSRKLETYKQAKWFSKEEVKKQGTSSLVNKILDL